MRLRTRPPLLTYLLTMGDNYLADAANHTWTITTATADTALPPLPHSLPLRHSGGDLNLDARHIILALYLNRLDLHLPDPHLSAPRPVPRTPEAWADTAPEEVADYLRRAYHQFKDASDWQRGTPDPRSKLLYPAHRPLPPNQKSPEGWVTFWDVHLTAPSKAAATRMDPTDQRDYVQDLEKRLREAHSWHASAASPQRGRWCPLTTNSHKPRKAKTGQRTRQHACQQGAAPKPGPWPHQAAPLNVQNRDERRQQYPPQHSPGATVR